ncbi:MAG TPA: hypothetical protein VMP86_02060, partial [Candidatus Binatia bacterium]|nr:hypothetical protein [Candidatus Binatia bacterium]
MRRVTALLALLALVLTMLPAAALAAPQAGSTGARLQTDLPGQVAGSWIVTLRPGVDAASAAERLAKAHAGRVGFIYTAVLNGFSFHGSDTAAAALARNPSVRTVVANRAVAIVAQ